jgi:hypothetical protein
VNGVKLDAWCHEKVMQIFSKFLWENAESGEPFKDVANTLDVWACVRQLKDVSAMKLGLQARNVEVFGEIGGSPGQPVARR